MFTLTVLTVVSYGGPEGGLEQGSTSDVHVTEFKLTPVPEPSTLALGLLGCVGVGLAARRKR